MKTSEDGRLCSLGVAMESPFVISVKCFTHIRDTKLLKSTNNELSRAFGTMILSCDMCIVIYGGSYITGYRSYYRTS